MPDHDYLWDPAATPDPEIARLEEALRPLRYRPAEPPALAAARPRRARTALRVAAVAVLALGGGVLWRATQTPWTVTTLQGRVAADAQPVEGGPAVLRAGQWVETGAASAARIEVGSVGVAELGPGSRARLVRSEANEYRMALQRGTLHARIWAPPRFFLVETPGALAIDLGCIYTLTVDDAGAGLLRVESGEVELVEGARRAAVPAGNEATLTPGVGPGLPYPTYARAGLIRAVRRYERAPDAAALHALLAAADGESTITLWHLLQRVSPAERPAVYARLTAVAAAPEGVLAADALALDPAALFEWRRTLERDWSPEALPAWKRLWRKIW